MGRHRNRLRMVTEREITVTYETGRRLRSARIAAGYSQTEFAEMIECSNSDLNRAEKGEKMLPLYCFLRACQVLKKDMNTMCGRRGKIKKK